MTKWRKMNSAPRDGTPILVGLWVNRDRKPEQIWEQFVAFYDNESLRGYAQNYKDLPWPWENFDAWTVIPKPPHWGKE